MNPDHDLAARHPTRWSVLTAAPHRLAFLCGFASLLLASAWWACHLLARYGLAPAAALDMQLAPIWAHSFLMLFTVFPTFFLGFLFTTYPRWMNGPLVSRRSYVATPLLLTAASLAWLIGVHGGPGWQLVAVALALAGLAAALIALLRVLVDAQQVVPHAIVRALHLRSASCRWPGSATVSGTRMTSLCTSPCGPRCGVSCYRCSSRSAIGWCRSSHRTS